jgi:transcriptional regulator with XRE-family HTH domain
MKEMSFAENLKHLMKSQGVSVRVLSQATGVPSSTISEWTAGREPKLSEPVVKLARYFSVSLEYLVTGKEPEPEIIGKLLDDADDSFFTIHRGVYRVHVEKFRGKKK